MKHQNNRKKDVLRPRDRFERVFSRCVYGIRRRRHSAGVSPFELIFGVVLRIVPADPVALIFKTSDTHYELELLSSLSLQGQKREEQVRRIGDLTSSAQCGVFGSGFASSSVKIHR